MDQGLCFSLENFSKQNKIQKHYYVLSGDDKQGLSGKNCDISTSAQ